jgi:hypothetical protein
VALMLVKAILADLCCTRKLSRKLESYRGAKDGKQYNQYIINACIQILLFY